MSLFESKTVVCDGESIELNLYPDGHIQILPGVKDGGLLWCSRCSEYRWRGFDLFLDRLFNPLRWGSAEHDLDYLIRRAASKHKAHRAAKARGTGRRIWEARS